LSAKSAGAGHTRKHSRGGGSKKHQHGKGKHNPQHHPKAHHNPQKQPVHTVAHPGGLAGGGRRGLALADDLACCPSEALAASLRLTGRPVSDYAVWALHERVRDADDAGASILATLEAASTWGLGGVRPVSWSPAGAGPGTVLGVDLPGPHTVTVAPCGCWLSWGELHQPWGATAEECWEVTWPS
jgi:hypothetical protein